MKAFDRHADPILRATPITKSYRNNLNARRFLTRECGDTFGFDRPFMEMQPKNGSGDRLKSGKRSSS